MFHACFPALLFIVFGTHKDNFKLWAKKFNVEDYFKSTESSTGGSLYEWTIVKQNEKIKKLGVTKSDSTIVSKRFSYTNIYPHLGTFLNSSATPTATSFSQYGRVELNQPGKQARPQLQSRASSSLIDKHRRCHIEEISALGIRWVFERQPLTHAH